MAVNHKSVGLVFLNPAIDPALSVPMTKFLQKSLLRPIDRINLSSQYLGAFFLAGLLGYIEIRALDSYVLMRYFKFIVENQATFTLAYSVVILVWHYKFVTSSRKEVRCRLLVGDRMSLIRLRYTLECATILGLCFLLAFAVDVVINVPPGNTTELFAIFALYFATSALFMEAR